MMARCVCEGQVWWASRTSGAPAQYAASCLRSAQHAVITAHSPAQQIEQTQSDSPLPLQAIMLHEFVRPAVACSALRHARASSRWRDRTQKPARRCRKSSNATWTRTCRQDSCVQCAHPSDLTKLVPCLRSESLHLQKCRMTCWARPDETC